MPNEKNSLQVTNKAVLTVAVPMALGYLTTPLVGIADTAIVGQLGSAALIGGVAVAAVFMSVLLTTLNFLRFSTSALTAQAFGRGENSDTVGVLLRSSLIAIVAGSAIVLLSPPILSLGLWLMAPSAAVGDAAGDYFLIRALATPFTLLNYVFFAWCVGTDRPVLSFLLQTFLNAVNVAVSYHLVLNLGMGIAGAAWGTVIAETATAAIALFFLAKPVLAEKGHLTELIFDIGKLKAMMIQNSDIMVRSFCLFAAFAFFTRQSAQQSDTILAANEILMHFFMIAGYFLDGFAVAAEQFVGRAIGAGRIDIFRRAILMTSLWNLGQAAALSLVFALVGHAMIDFMTPNEDVRTVAGAFIAWALFTPLIGVAAFQMDGVFIGATWSKDMRNSMLTSLVSMVLSYYLLFPLLGNHGLWLALYIFLGLRGFTLYLIMRRREGTAFQPV